MSLYPFDNDYVEPYCSRHRQWGWCSGCAAEREQEEYWKRVRANRAKTIRRPKVLEEK